jgi:hypothetical protein
MPLLPWLFSRIKRLHPDIGFSLRLWRIHWLELIVVFIVCWLQDSVFFDCFELPALLLISDILRVLHLDGFILLYVRLARGEVDLWVGMGLREGVAVRIPADHVLVFLEARDVVGQQRAHLLLDINLEVD